ncbi:hypothetical protein RND71_019639 [Anisodus tanguticus]|uniref:Protein kinase domain-containing protein n=1 Tax=Anisodus tanguticus TaxID=243964 RepID=A0AAE1RZT8_9SOLA|nr:hypothetical protein RND71_019639 [Anisodus tanguticus]
MNSDALHILEEMSLLGIVPDLQTYSGLMNHFALHGDIKTVQRLFGMVGQSGLEPDAYMYKVLIHAYCKCGRAALALRVFEDTRNSGLLPDANTKQLLVKTQTSSTDTDTDFSCSLNPSMSCDSYVTYRARPPNYFDVGSVSDLLEVSRLSIAKATGLASEDTDLFPDQLLLELYHVVQDMNPTLDPTNLTVGAEAVFPLFCKCPVHSDLEKGLEYLVTYVWQPWDDILPVSNMFGASAADIVAANNYRNFTDAICRPVLIPVKLPIILQSYPSSARSRKSKRGWILIPVLSIMGLLAVFSFCLMVYMRLVDEKRRANLAHNCSTLETSDLFHTKKSSKDEIMDHKTIQDKLLPGVSGYIGKPIIYDLKIIMEETMNLSERYRIGGSMYKATINDQIVAVKKTKQASEELTILQKLNHANLVKLMGVSSDDHGSFFLVYEYAEMAHWISGCFPDHHPLLLPLAQWYRSVGAKAKIASFSTAKHATNSLVLKVDVLAFGLVLLELFSGNKAMEAKDEIEGILEVEDNREEKFRRWMDPKWSFYPVDDALNLAALAKACTSEKSAERPRMTDIVFNLCFLNHLSKCMGSLGLQVKLRRLFRLLVR